MGKHCTEELADCIADCVRRYGDSWRATFCTLDCELTYAMCVIRDFSRAFQGKDLAQASETATKMEEVGHAYLTAAANLRTKASIGYASLKVKKANGETEPFYPEAKLLPSLVTMGINPVIARLVTDRTVLKFQDGMSTADLKAESLSELEKINPKLVEDCDCKKSEKKDKSNSTNTPSTDT